MSAALLPLESVARCIFQLRGRRVILDADLAAIYGVTTKRLNEAVKRNPGRFPDDFVFYIERKELATAPKRIFRHAPFAFTEHGAIMAAAMLNSPRAVQMSLFVVMKQLFEPPESPRKRIGFGVAESRGVYRVQRGQGLPNRRHSS